MEDIMLNPLFNLKAPKGWEYCLGSELDPVRIKELKDQGFTPVSSDRYPDLSDFNKDGYIKYRGLILLERLTEVGDKHRAVLNSLVRTPDKVIADMQDGLDALSEKMFYESCKNLKESGNYKPYHLCDEKDIYNEEKNHRKSLIEIFVGFFKRKKRHYYACGESKYSKPIIFPKTRKFIETIQYKFRFGKYKLDEEEKQVCKGLYISEESYIKEKYKIEIDAIY